MPHGQKKQNIKQEQYCKSRVTRATLFSKGSPPPHSGVYSPRPSMLSPLSQHKHLSISGSWTLCHSFSISSGKTPTHSSKPTRILPLPGSLFFFYLPTFLPSCHRGFCCVPGLSYQHKQGGWTVWGRRSQEIPQCQPRTKGCVTLGTRTPSPHPAVTGSD